MFERLSAKALVLAGSGIALCAMTFAGFALLGYAVFTGLELVLATPLAAAAAAAILLLAPASVICAVVWRAPKKGAESAKPGLRLASLASFLGEPSIAKAALSGLAMRRPMIALVVAILVAFLRVDMRQTETDGKAPAAAA